MNKTISNPSGRRRGSALILGVLVSVVVTSVVMVVAWTASTLAQAGGSLSKMDQAVYAAESGAQKVAWYCRNNKMNLITSPISGTVNGYTYTASWTTVSGSTIRITSASTYGSSVYTMYQTATPPAGTAPAISLGDNFDNKNLTVTGDVVTGGSYNNTGGGTLNGNLTYETSASNTGSVTGTKTKATGAYSFMNMTTLGTTLINAAGLTLTGTQTNHTFDFTAVSGSPKVIYVNGPVVNPSFIGSGTLYSSGAVSGLGSFGTVSNPVNIVAKAAITNTSGNLTIYGSMYTGGAWSYGQITMTGIVYSSGTISATSTNPSSLTVTAAPWFDPRTAGSGSSTSGVFTSFAGPNP